jgi:hypothetical protein
MLQGNRFRFRSLSVLLLAATIAACSDATSGETVAIWFAEPMDGAVVTGPDINVVLGASGVEIASTFIDRPGTGHHHIFINRDVTPLNEPIPAGEPDIRHFGGGETEFVLIDLPPGEHRLIAVLADHLHVPLDPVAVDTIHITVVAPE